jgi:hypothetical protein
MTSTSLIWLPSTIKTDAILQFAIDDGRVLTWDHGHRVDCRVAFLSVVPGWFTLTERGIRPDANVIREEDLIVARVEVASDTGEVYGAERTLSANVFVEAIRTAHCSVRANEELDPIATGVTYHNDSRRYMTAMRDGDNIVCFYLKNLVGTLDLFRGSIGQLVIRLHATTLGAPGGSRTPEVTMQTHAAGQIVLMPSLLSHGMWLPPAPLVFTRCEHSARPQQGVRAS